MKRSLCNIITACLLLTLVSTAFAGDNTTIRLKDGSRWRGAVNDVVTVTALEQRIEVKFAGTLVKAADLYIVLETEIAGVSSKKTIFKGDIVTMKTVTGDEVDSNPRATRSKPNKKKVEGDDIPRDAEGNPIGVFVLPLEGPVGEDLRHQEIDMIGEEADKYGPGQIIVLTIKSNGGLVYEAELINESIEELRKRHRVVAWVTKAVSAGCSTAMSCDEIYFRTNGIAGSVTTIRGRTSVPEAEAQKGIDHLVETAIKNGMSEHIARAMKLNKFVCSYDKNEKTGECTFYGDMSGEFVLSTDEQNLCFNAKNALHCGFSSGTADTEEDLANLLNLPRWYEISDYGRTIAADWQRTAKQVKTDIHRWTTRLGYYKTGGGDPVEILGARIKIWKDLLRCYDRAELIAYMSLGMEPEQIERQIAEMKKQLADMKRAQRGR